MKIANKPHSYCGKPQTPNTIVFHALAEYIDFDDVDLTGWEHVNKLGWGAHFYITPSGTIVQSIPMDSMGAHAKGHNMDTIGIEFIVPGLHTYESFTKAIDQDWVSEAQVQAGIKLVDYIKSRNEKVQYITSHHYLSPERKFDPGKGFPYDRFVNRFGATFKSINFTPSMDKTSL